MDGQDKVNILVVDDQPAKLVSYEVILTELGENLIKAGSGREALELLLKNEVAVILVDVCMPQLDGFQLATLIRDHPRFSNTAIVFISAVQMDDFDRLRGYEMGAVDYVPVPIVPELLRAKVKVFIELYRKTRQLEQLNLELERRVAERTMELEAANARLQLAIDVAQLGTWDWDLRSGESRWSDRFHEIFGYRPDEVQPGVQAWSARLHSDDASGVTEQLLSALDSGGPFHHVYRCVRPNGTVSWCEARGQQEVDAAGLPRRMMGIVMDITDHKLAEERQRLMVQELHHRVKNTLASVQAIAGLTARMAPSVEVFVKSFSKRIQSLSRTHTMLVSNNWQRIRIHELLNAELGSFAGQSDRRVSFSGPDVKLHSDMAVSLGLVLHELATNAAKYGALSVPDGRIEVCWKFVGDMGDANTLEFTWTECNGPLVRTPQRRGFGSTLLEKIFAGQTGSVVEIKYPPTGLEFRAAVPIP
ncbi:MAG: HWE histidine kinase domain-containing protein [Hyphomicrobiaceae bacterium]